MSRWSQENAFDDLVFWASSRYGIPSEVIKATIATESGFDPHAFRAELAIHDASRGLMQVLFSTAQGLGYKGFAGNDDEKTGGLYEPQTSIQLGVLLLSQLRKRYPSAGWDEIYAGYNAGSIRRDSTGALVNERNVAHWRSNYAHFAPAAAAAAAPSPSDSTLPPVTTAGPDDAGDVGGVLLAIALLGGLWLLRKLNII